jgi:Holliday junction resolvasome RuvABC endonuclease subunit
MFIIGLDPSLQKAGYVVLDIDAPDNVVEDRGLLKTRPADGILVQRLIKQAAQVEAKIKKYNVSFIGMEAPYFEGFNAERLYALNQFLHRVFLKLGCYVVSFPPQQLKKLVFPNQSVDNIHKPHMIDRAKTVLGLHGLPLAEDVADAYWAGYFGKRYYKWHIQKEIKEDELGEYEKKVFCGTHTFVRGPKKGITERTGIIYRDNELFFDFKAIKRRSKNASKKVGGNKKSSRRSKS